MNANILFAAVSCLVCVPAFAAAVPHPEHPRPDFHRDPWVNLNGEWQFDFDPRDVGETERWFEPGRHAFGRKITVPFPWEAKRSGIGDVNYKGIGWYAREIPLPSGAGWDGKDAWLIIGACDFAAAVWVNGKPAGKHVGGYMPLEVNLSPFARPGEKAHVIIRVKDETGPEQPSGKQTGWYTRTSGIWQTVYLEPRAEHCIRSFQSQSHLTTGSFVLNVAVSRDDCEISVRSPDGAIESLVADLAGGPVPPSGKVVEGPVGVVVRKGVAKLSIKLKNPKPWSPDSPTLYPFVLEVRKDGKTVDAVNTYLGLREVSIGKAPGRDYNYIYLNGKPIYLAGALHQSFHPDGIYQYPDDATVRGDYEYCKKIGLNFLRIHIKNATPRELYWADKLGVLIMQDMPNFTDYTEKSRRFWEQNLRAAIARDFNHPAIFAWCDFNETWGLGGRDYKPETQQWVADMYRLTKQLDPTRLVEDNSPCLYDHVITDINSWHFYINDYAQAKAHIQEVVDKTFPGSTFNYAKGYKQADAPLINSEYGGISAGHGDQDVSWCFKYLTNELRKHDKICGYVYTELSDIEWEHNGFLNYDRSEKEFGYDHWHPGFTLKDLNNPDFIVLDAEPCIVLQPGEKRSVPVAISHWSERQAKQLKLRWRTDWTNRFGERRKGSWKMQPATWKPFAVTPHGTVSLAPKGRERIFRDPSGIRKPGVEYEYVVEEPGLGVLIAELVDGDEVLARNYLNTSVDMPSQRTEVVDERRVALRFKPADYSAWHWESQSPALATGIAAEKAWAHGAGWIEYQVQVPDKLDLADLDSIELLAELSAKTNEEKLDWQARKTPHDYPQTDRKKWPTDVRISINGVEVERQTLPDDPADARGVLSHVNRYHPGSYGWLVRPKLSGETLKRTIAAIGGEQRLMIRFEVPADAEHRGGLAIFGEKLGCYPVDPTVMLAFRNPHKLTVDFTSDKPVAVNRLAALQQVVIPTAEQGGHEWRYTVDKPAEDWITPAFDDAKWRTSKGGFGTRETPNAIIGKKWTTHDIWLRTTIDVKDAAAIASARWCLYHDEDAEVYVNGTKVLEPKGYVTDYFDVPLDAAALRLLHDGRNVVAVHCRQTEGGQNIDVGLTIVRRP